ncbi:MAG: hydrogenase 3 maturation endopeptidase HyCI [Candidatus Omnitrophica bacterium]|nr:hydrogenase 3 maturation endopeptidase HyCI [Candidatus Omnitrophota bacterium]
MLEHLKAHLTGKVVILGIGNTLRSDDGIGSLLASRLKDKLSYIVYDAGVSPENYLGKVDKDKPDNLVIIDAVDFGGKPGEFRAVDGEGIKTTNLFSTHNASLSMLINFLQSNSKMDIIVLIIQPKTIAFGDKLSPEITKTLVKLESFFMVQGSI